MGKTKIRKKIKQPADFGLMLSVILLTIIGIVMVYSASSPEAVLRYDDGFHFVKRHAIWAFLGMLSFALTMKIDYHSWKKLAPWIFSLSLVLGLAIYTPLGIELKGARRWIDVGFATLMPSDAIKIGSIIFFASFLDRKKDSIKSIKHGTIPALVIIGIPAVIIYFQPDLSTTVTLVLTLGIMYFIGGMYLGWVLVIPPVATMLVYKAIMSEGNEYRIRRVTAFLDPFADKLGAGWQIVQSLYALGAGGIFGSGLGQSRQKHFYISEAYNDFIFAIIGEELGLIGTVFVFSLYVYIIYKGIMIAVNAKDLFGTYLATGITSIFAIQTLINIGTVTSSIPATGITLPLMSFGGTSLVIYLASLGMLLNISKNGRKRKRNAKAVK